jgi:hypothetical protein
MGASEGRCVKMVASETRCEGPVVCPSPRHTPSCSSWSLNTAFAFIVIPSRWRAWGCGWPSPSLQSHQALRPSHRLDTLRHQAGGTRIIYTYDRAFPMAEDSHTLLSTLPAPFYNLPVILINIFI